MTIDCRHRTRLAVARWMRAVLEDRNWTANAWANAAGTSPTNITRVMAPGDGPVPSCETIAKLALVAHTQPDLIVSDAHMLVLTDPTPPSYCPECGFDLRGITQLLRPPPVLLRGV